MTSPDIPATSTGRGATSRRPNWTKLHLIYFALAGFDMLAVGTGLWLSNHTNEKFSVSVSEIMVADAIRDNALVAANAALALGRPVSEIFVHKNVTQARVELTAASKLMDRVVAQDHDEFGGDHAGEHAEEEEGSGHDESNLVETIHHGLSQWLPEAITPYEAAESELVKAQITLVTHANAALDAFEFGNTGRAVSEMAAADAAQAAMIVAINRWFDLSGNFSDTILAQSGEEMEFTENLQMIMGAFIVAMVLLVVFYAHFMGRVLRRKFEEIETAQQESEKLGTQLRVVNEDISNLNVELSKNVRSLVEAQEEIVRKGKLAQLGQLTATVAHELRNPLGAVRTAAFLALRKVQGKGTGIEPQLDRVATGVTRCDAIITQLLDFSRSSVTAVESKDLDTWLIGVLEEQAQTIPSAVAMEVAAGLGGQAVEFDEGRLRRAIINLVSNASEAMVGKGNDPALFTTHNPKIVVETRLSARGAEVIVSDNGPGIAPEHLEKILEPLFTTKNFGTGLGLPAVQRIMEQHGGGLEVHSEHGKGAYFTAWLPLVQAGVNQAKAA
jgi:signal transduction histidine kinase